MNRSGKGDDQMLFNCHTHTHYSHDSAAAIPDICSAAVDAGLSGVLFSDHCDCEYAAHTDYIRLFSLCREEFLTAQRDFAERLQLTFGIELGDPLYMPSYAPKILNALPFDAVLLSVHAVRFQAFEAPFSTISFEDQDEKFIQTYLNRYFEDMLISVQTFDFDILCHLTGVLRYIILKYHKTVCMEPFLPLIEKILETVIVRDKTLEINTSALSAPNGFLMPDETIIDMYLSMGGTAFSLGSDAHAPENIALGLQPAADILRQKGIRTLCYYKNRKRIDYTY